jgi:hypothetical protein
MIRQCEKTSPIVSGIPVADSTLSKRIHARHRLAREPLNAAGVVGQIDSHAPSSPRHSLERSVAPWWQQTTALVRASDVLVFMDREHLLILGTLAVERAHRQADAEFRHPECMGFLMRIGVVIFQACRPL